MVRLSIPARLSFRDLALSTVLGTIEAERSGDEVIPRDEIVSALSEAFNNIVLHAYRGVHGASVELHVDARPGEVEIRLLDRGRGFDPESVSGYTPADLDEEDDPPYDLAALPEGGMGLFIIRSFMDEVVYTRGGGGKPNVLALQKRWPAKAGVEPGSAAAPGSASRKETSQSGWRMRSVAVPSFGQRTAGSLKRK